MNLCQNVHEYIKNSEIWLSVGQIEIGLNNGLNFGVVLSEVLPYDALNGTNEIMGLIRIAHGFHRWKTLRNW